MDPFHVVRLAGDALDQCRRRIQLTTHGHRGFKDDPRYKSRRTLHTTLGTLFAEDAHVEVEATRGIYLRMIAAHQDRRQGRELMDKLITDLSTGVPKALTEAITTGWTLKKLAADVLAYFDRPGIQRSDEALNGRLGHFGGPALGFRNLTN